MHTSEKGADIQSACRISSQAPASAGSTAGAAVSHSSEVEGAAVSSIRRTVIAHGRLAMRELRLRAARERRHGLQVMTFEQLAARLAGGFCRPVDDETVRAAIQTVLPDLPLGELDSIKDLPGLLGAAVDTLRKAWRAGIDLRGHAAEHPRLASIARLEEAVVTALPPAMMRPADLVQTALQRLEHCTTLFREIEIVGITELSPCWRPLLHAIAGRVPVRWVAGPRAVPTWLDAELIEIVRTARSAPTVTAVSAATAYHEAIEALRWARELVVSAAAAPSEIAIASVSPGEYDDHFLALRSDANLDLHFVHGIRVTACRDGQAAAALADILTRGLSQARMRRLSALLRAYPGPFRDLPDGWTRILPAGAPLTSADAWIRALDRLRPSDWPDEADHAIALRGIVALLDRGTDAAEEAGEMLLRGRTREIWRTALLAGPAASLEATLETLRIDDGLEACASIAWMPASALAASPRRFVRLLGLNSSRWPRGISEDRLIPDHIIPTAALDPLPVGAADRRDFETILATTEREVVLSRARRNDDGRLLGRSTLLQVQSQEIYLRRNRVPAHAFSETDRLMARREEFQSLPQAMSAAGCWRDWARPEITPHDGLVRADHPLLRAILDRTQSASSLKLLLRNPLGFVWHYGLRWRAPDSGDDPLTVDPLAMGSLVHMTLDAALRSLEAAGGFSVATADRIAAAVDAATNGVALQWEEEQAVPPLVIWQRALDEVQQLCVSALSFPDERLPNARCYSEVPFGGMEPKSDGPLPWDPTVAVAIPGTDFHIAAYIDRLDLSGDGRRALVRDYKTGRQPRADIILDGGKELQRCLYAFAVKALLGDDLAIEASLLYPREGGNLRLADPDLTLDALARHLGAARASLISGAGVLGPDAAGSYDELALAMPANAGAAYCKRKIAAAAERLGAAAQVWDAP
jgi:hypothetical protein